MKNKVTASNFLDWYFSEEDDTLYIGDCAIDMLKAKGRFNITAKDVFDFCGYIPAFICEDDADPLLEYAVEEVEFIDDLTKH